MSRIANGFLSSLEAREKLTRTYSEDKIISFYKLQLSVSGIAAQSEFLS